MENRIWNRTLLLAVSAAALANLSIGLSPSRGAETPPDPRLLLEKSAEQLVESVLDTAGYYRLASRNDESLALLETGLEVCADAGRPVRCRARILNGQGRTLTRARRYQEAAESLEEARDLATQTGDDLTRAAALNALGNNLLRQEGFVAKQGFVGMLEYDHFNKVAADLLDFFLCLLLRFENDLASCAAGRGNASNQQHLPRPFQ